MKLDEKKCSACYGKRFYTTIFGFTGFEDFGGDGFKIPVSIHRVACPKCNRHNKRKIKGVRATVYFK